MHSHVLKVAALALSAGLVPAQAGPAVLRSAAPSPAFANMFPGSFQLERLPGDAAGIYTCAMTVFRGPTRPPVVQIGKLDRDRDRYTPTREANALNDPNKANMGLSLEPVHGRYAVFVRGGPRGPDSVWFAARRRAGDAFSAAVPLAGVGPNQGFFALGRVNGKLRIFYPEGVHTGPAKTVVMRDLDVTDPRAPRVTGDATIVATLTAGGLGLWGVTAITGPDGDVEGLLLSEIFAMQGQSRLVFKPDLDPRHPGSVLLQLDPSKCRTRTCTVGQGGIAGGRVVFQAVGAGPPSGQDVETAWLLGDVVEPGGTADIVGAIDSSTNRAKTFVGVASGVTPPIRIPGMVGHFALHTGALLFLAPMEHATADQLARAAFRVPGDSSLRGTSAAIQGLSLDAGDRTHAFTNTAWISIR